MEIFRFHFFQNYGAQVLPLHVQSMFCNNCFSKLCNILLMECICTKNLAQSLKREWGDKRNSTIASYFSCYKNSDTILIFVHIFPTIFLWSLSTHVTSNSVLPIKIKTRLKRTPRHRLLKTYICSTGTAISDILGHISWDNLAFQLCRRLAQILP